MTSHHCEKCIVFYMERELCEREGNNLLSSYHMLLNLTVLAKLVWRSGSHFVDEKTETKRGWLTQITQLVVEQG